jgi:predicted TIM-barrel fold metal-dependent hydrolase
MTTEFDRRKFLAGFTALPLAATAQAAQQQDGRVTYVREEAVKSVYVAPAAPIIDCHIHMFDKTKPGGSLYSRDLPPGLSNLPGRYRWTVHGTGIVGVIVTECSTWPEETLWVLDQCATDPMFVGHCGFLDFGTPEFVKYFDRFRANKLFLGVRYANRTGRNFEEGINRPVFLADIKTMTDAGLVLEYGNPMTVLRLTDKLPPTAKVVIPHLPRVRLAQNSVEAERYRTTLRELGKRPNVAFKLSGVTKTIDGAVVSDLNVLQGWLDEIWDIFGEDRIVFGTDFPHEDRTAPFLNVLSTSTSYVRMKLPAAQEKVLWRNSVRIYRWIKRAPNQPTA